jgi:hypothetical protein
MNHKISAFCDKIDSVKKMSDILREMKYGEEKAPTNEIDAMIQTIQADCLLLANDKGDYAKENYDYSGVDHGFDHGLYDSEKK